MSWDSISFWIEHNPGLASWVQAFGSIAAILVAVWISGGERRHKFRVEKAARRDALTRAVDAVEHAESVAQQCRDSFKGRPQRADFSRHLAFVENAIARMKDVSAGPGIDSEVHGHLHEASSALLDVKHRIEEYVQGTRGIAVVQGGLIRKNVERLQKTLSGLRATKL